MKNWNWTTHGGACLKFKKNILKSARFLFGGRGSSGFLSLRGPILKQHNVICFDSIQKGALIILMVVIIDFSTLRGYQFTKLDP